MDHEAQQLRTSQSWPPGFFVGSVVLDADAARSRRRDMVKLVALAVCASCLGFIVTDSYCQSNEKLATAAIVARYRSHNAAATGARARSHDEVTDAIAVTQQLNEQHARVAESARQASVLVPRAAAQKRAKPARAAVSPRSQAPAPSEITAEPTPALSDDELNEALARADASTRIFASVDETSPKPVVVVPPPTAAVVHTARTSSDSKVVVIEGLSVNGALTSKVVQRGVQRLLPQYDRCREFSDRAPQRVQLSATIDEAGHSRRVTVEGQSHGGLRHCLEQATSHLVVPAPDTGTARARWFVRFAAR